MTVIEFGKRDLKINSFIMVLVGVGIVSVVAFVVMYSNLVSLRHSVQALEEDIAHARVTNAELKNEVYQIVDQNASASFLQSQGLVLDSNPHYVESSPALSHLMTQ